MDLTDDAQTAEASDFEATQHARTPHDARRLSSFEESTGLAENTALSKIEPRSAHIPSPKRSPIPPKSSSSSFFFSSLAAGLASALAGAADAAGPAEAAAGAPALALERREVMFYPLSAFTKRAG